MAKFKSITFQGGEGKNRWYHVVLCEGRNREVRRLWESQPGIKVSRLIRVRFGQITLPPLLRPGKTRELDLSEIELLEQKGKSHVKPFQKTHVATHPGRVRLSRRKKI